MKILRASPGCAYINGESYGATVALPDGADASGWREVAWERAEAEAEAAIRAREAEEAKRAEEEQAAREAEEAAQRAEEEAAERAKAKARLRTAKDVQPIQRAEGGHFLLGVPG